MRRCFVGWARPTRRFETPLGRRGFPPPSGSQPGGPCPPNKTQTRFANIVSCPGRTLLRPLMMLAEPCGSGPQVTRPGIAGLGIERQDSPLASSHARASAHSPPGNEVWRNPTSLSFVTYVKCGDYPNSLFCLQPFGNSIRSKGTLSRSEDRLTKWIRGDPVQPGTREARMLTKPWRRLRSPAAWALVMILGAPMLAEAQQGGLFPLAPIRRQRVPCHAENPVYGLYRHEYFGYHPTCWRRFPAGWGCPSPEAPDAAASFAKRPRDPALPMTPEDFGGPGRDREGMEPEGAEPPPGPEGEQLPPLPDDKVRTPFQPDKPEASPAPRAEPRPTPPPGGANPNPLDLPAAPAERPSNPPTAERPSNPPPADLPTPTGRVESPTLPGPVEAPLLALPDPAPSAPAMNVPGSATPAGPVIGPGASSSPPRTPAQAPRRTSLLGGLFNRSRR
jgi:hypothetical protein